MKKSKAKKGKITMKKYLAVTLCALSAAAVVTACSAGDRNDSEYKQGEYEESTAVTTTREAVTSRAQTTTTKRRETSRAESSSVRESSSSRRESSSSDMTDRDDSGDLMSRVGEGIDDVISGGGEVIDDTLDTGREVVDDIFE